MYEIPIPLLIRNDSLSFNNENLIRGYHVYMEVWSPLLGKRLFATWNLNSLENMWTVVMDLKFPEGFVFYGPEKVTQWLETKNN